MNVLLVTSLFTFLVVVIPYWFMPYITPKSIQFGVRIPREREADQTVADIRKQFHYLLLIGSAIMFVLLLFLPAYFGYYTITLFSMPLEIVFSYLVYYRSFRRLHSVKETQDWYSNLSQSSGAVYDIESGLKKSVSGFFFIIPAVAVLLVTVYVGIIIYPSLPFMIPTHFGVNGQPDQYSVKSIGSVFLLTFIQAAMTIGMFILGYVITKTREEIDVSRPTTSYEQQERFKWYTRDSLYLFTSVINLTMMFSSFNTWELVSTKYLVVMILLPVLLGSTVLIAVLMSFGQMGSRLNVPGSRTEDTGLTNRSDDKEWKGGVINYNKENPSILVGKRFGVGWTFNFARADSWIILALLIALPIIIVLIVRMLQ